MNIIDLELYKWKLYQEGIFKRSKVPITGQVDWWLNNGMFISTLPRQSGKTELLIRMSKILQQEKENFIFIVPNQITKHDILNRTKYYPNDIRVCGTLDVVNYFKNIQANFTHLLIDEYCSFYNFIMKELLTINWKSVSAVGSLQL